MKRWKVGTRKSALPLLVCALGVLISLWNGCARRPVEHVVYQVVKVDSIHGIAYPYEFTRARDLIDNRLYLAAAYDYVMLYHVSKDSTVHECLRMDSVLQVTHDKESVSYYLKQSLVTEEMNDPDVNQNGKVNQDAYLQRFNYCAALLDDLAEYGIKE